MGKKKNKQVPTETTTDTSAPVQQNSQPQRSALPVRQDRPKSPDRTFQRQQQRSQQPSRHQPKPLTLSRLLSSRWFPIVFVLLIALLPSFYFYHKSQQIEQKSSAPSASLQTTAEVVKRVSRHIVLPSGEQPTVATVSDASKVRNQAFFSNAASGDKVLVYAQAKKAYLYRPSIDRMIEVAPLAPSTKPTNSSTSP